MNYVHSFPSWHAQDVYRNALECKHQYKWVSLKKVML
jgi:hypothetical protein